MNISRLLILFMIFGTLANPLAFAASSSANYQLNKYVISAGGGQQDSTDYKLSSVIAQDSTVKISSSNNYNFAAGFLPLSNDMQDVQQPLDITATTNPSQICANEPFDVTFQVTANADNPVDGANLYFNFDPDVLQIAEYTKGNALSFVLQQKIDNDAGYMSFSAADWGSDAETNPFDLVTVRFTPQQKTTTQLDIHNTHSNMQYQGQYIPVQTTNIPITIGDCFKCIVNLQGRPDAPHANWITALDIHASGEIQTIMTNSSGVCMLPSTVTPGDMSFCVKNSHTLANKIGPPVPQLNNGDLLSLGTLYEGDVSNDNEIDFADVALLQAALNTCVGDANYNLNADLNADGCINNQDIAVGFGDGNGNESNFGRPSACSLDTNTKLLRKRAIRSSQPIPNAVTFSTTEIPYYLAVNDSFDMTIYVNASQAQTVDGSAVYLNFDPKLLRVNQLTAGEQFDFVLEKAFDNDKGLIDFAATTWSTNFPQGYFPLVTVNLTLLAENGADSLQFNTTGHRKTEAMSGGKTVSDTENVGQVAVEKIVDNGEPIIDPREPVPEEVGISEEEAAAAELEPESTTCSQWNLHGDFVTSPNHQNPNPDSCDMQEIWHFKTASIDNLHNPDSYELMPKLLTGDMTEGFGQHDYWAGENYEHRNGLFMPFIGVKHSVSLYHIRLHPSPNEAVIVGWQSPIEGTVKVQGSVINLDERGQVAWFVDKNNLTLDSGIATDAKPQPLVYQVEVNVDDFLYFIIEPNGRYLYDSTNLDISIELEDNIGQYQASGHLHDEQGNPLAGATVQVGEQIVTTDANGYWEINDLAENQHELIASLDGYIFKPISFVTSHNTPEVTVEMPAPSSALDVVIEQTPSVVLEGEPALTYSIEVKNRGNETATGIKLVNTLPANVTAIEVETEAGQCQFDNNTLLHCDLLDLPTGQSWIVQVTVKPTQFGTLVNHVTVDSNEYPQNDDTIRTYVRPHFSVSSWVKPYPVLVDNNMVYHVKVMNGQHSSASAENAAITLTLPDGVSFISANVKDAQGICQNHNQLVTCQLNSIQIGDYVKVEVIAKAEHSGMQIHDIEASALDFGTVTTKGKVYIINPVIPSPVDVAFLVDITGSMQNDIDAVAKTLTQVITDIETNNQDTPMVGLITFKDEVVSVTTTDDLRQIIAELQAIQPSGGNQHFYCPEASVQAMAKALELVNNDGRVILVTDASPHPNTDADEAKLAMDAKNIRFDTFLSGDCQTLTLQDDRLIRRRDVRSETQQCDISGENEIVSAKQVYACMTNKTGGIFKDMTAIKSGNEDVVDDYVAYMMGALQKVVDKVNFVEPTTKPPVTTEPKTGNPSPPPEPNSYWIFVGSPNGRVVSQPAGIDCNQGKGDCYAYFKRGTQLKLIPQAPAGLYFDHWTGDVGCEDGEFTITGTKGCGAIFYGIRNPKP